MRIPEIILAFDTHRNQAVVSLRLAKDKKLIALVKSGATRLKKPIQGQTLMQRYTATNPGNTIKHIYFHYSSKQKAYEM